MGLKDYTEMQRRYYAGQSIQWKPDFRDPVVGSFDEHNRWNDYDTYLMAGLGGPGQVALDFGCGPGRNIVRFWDCFDRMDGADLDPGNLSNARDWIQENEKDPNRPILYNVDGSTLNGVPSDAYDVVTSCIVLQHICVWSIRMSLIREFFRVLKPGGWLTAQMGMSQPDEIRRYYFEDYVDAEETNGRCDVAVQDPSQIESDLTAAGFVDFSYAIRPTGPGCGHEQWIYFRGRKP